MIGSSVHSLLFFCLFPISTSFARPPLFLVVQVGKTAILPCNWTQAEDTAIQFPPIDEPHLQWKMSQETVMERKGSRLFQGTGYEGRADVPSERIPKGDCSLRLLEVRYTDDGLYNSFIVVRQRRRKTRSFLQSVQLRVTDYKSRQMLKAGDDFILNLHTSQAATVIFHRFKDTEGTIKWKKDGEAGSQGLVEEGNGVLIFRNLNLTNSGLYKVLDVDGLAISSTIVIVEEAFKEPIVKGAEREAYSEGSSTSIFFTTVMVSLFCSTSMHFVL